MLQILGETLPYNNLAELRERMADVSPNLTKYNEVEEANYFKQASELAQVSLFSSEETFS